jgi:RNA polymerase sigma-70 factor (ECF subfamily)
VRDSDEIRGVKDRAPADMNPRHDRERLEARRTSAEDLYRAHAPFVAGFLARLGAPRPDMDDLLQEVFLVAHRRGGYVEGPAKPTTWLAEIALRVWANARRARGRRREDAATDRLEVTESAAPSPEEALDRAAKVARVQRCLDAMDDEHRAVFVLFELYGESGEEIAKALSIPIGTVHSRLHHARKKFQARWEREGARER